MKKMSQKILSFVLALTMIVPMFVMPATADAAPQQITSADGYSNIEVRVTTDKDPLNYRTGDTVTFTMKVFADNKHVSVPMIKYTLEGDGDATHTKLKKTGTLTPDANGVFTLTHDVIGIPGYMRLEGDIYSADGVTKWAETPDNDRAKALGAGILVNYEEITTVMPEPDDFDEVWEKRLGELEAVAPKIVRIDKVTKWYSSSTLKTSVSGSDVYAVYIDCIGNAGDVLKSDDLGNEAGATWAVAYLTVPKNKADGSMTISQGYQGYGINTATPVETSSGIAVNMSTHSLVLLNNDNAATSSTYKSTYTSYIKGGSNYGFDATDNSKIETCYFANLLLRDLQMLRFAKMAFGTEGAASLVDSNTEINGMTKSELDSVLDYWKGLYNGKVTTSGGSQGGFQALGVGALDHDVVSVNASIPWMGDTHTNTDTNRVQGSNRPKAGDGIRYCDTAFLAARIEAPVTITARLVDKSCVPTSVIPIWNNLVESKKDVDGYMGTITWVQSGTHGYTPSYPENPTQIIRTYELNEPTGIANTQGGFTKSGYTDIDGYTPDQDAPLPSTGYVQIGTKTQSSATVTGDKAPSFYWVDGGDAYYNAELKKLVFISSGTLKGHYDKAKSTSSLNSNSDGNIWYLEYWTTQNKIDIKEVEFRYGTGGGSFSGIGYIMSTMKAAQSVKYDSKIKGCSWGGQKDASIVVGMTSLTTLGHGTFAADGTFTAKSYTDGVVDLTGFTGIDTSYWKYFLYNCASVEEVITPTLAGANMFEGCSLLKTVTVPSGAALTQMGANGFKNCTKLEKINVECNLSSLTVGAAAFSGNTPIINVKTDADKAIVTNALSAASITGITVLSAGEEPPAVEPEPDKPYPPKGIANNEEGYTKSEYADIDSVAGYVQIGTGSQSKAKVADGFEPKLYYIKNGNAYYNASEKKLVLVSTAGGISAGSKENQVSTTQNSEDIGAIWYLAYWADMNSAKIEEVEFRGRWISKLGWIGYFTQFLKHATSVKLDSKIVNLDGANSASYSLFLNMTSLKSAGHVTFNLDGTSTPTTYKEGVVDLTGFTSVPAGALAYSLYNCESVTDVVTHILTDKNMFDGATALRTVTVPESTTLAAVGENVFNGCASLESIAVLGTVDPTIEISASAFTGTDEVNVIVNTLAEKGYFEAALAEAGVTNVTVTSVETDEPVEPDPTPDPDPDPDPDVPTLPEGTCSPIDAPNAITAESFMVRMKSYTGLRALFSFSESVAETNKANGLTLVSYGVVAVAYSRLMDEFGGDENALFNEAIKGERRDIKYVPVYNADGTGANRYTNYEKREFCVSLTNIASANSLTDVYTAGYVIWKDAEGNLGYTLSTYFMPDGEKAVNLYEITLGLTKNGLLNSEFVDDICFWQVLKNGALKTNSFNIANDSLVTREYTLDSGYFTYCDVDWHAYTSASGKNLSWWSSNKPTGVSSNASGITWSVLKYTDNEYVMIYRNKNMSGSISIPSYSVNTKYYAPYDYRFGAEISGITLAAYNPVLTQTDYEKIKTVVVDSGINGANSGCLGGLAKVKTIVYPSEFSVAQQAFIANTNLENVIWCHSDETGNPVKHLSEFSGLESLVDLRGLTSVGFSDTFNGDQYIANIVFNEITSSVSTEATFSGMSRLERVWTEGQNVPEKGVVDLTSMSFKTINNRTFAAGSLVKTIKLPSVVTAIKGTNSLGSTKTFDFICASNVEQLIIAYVKGEASGNGSTSAAMISVNGKSISTLIG